MRERGPMDEVRSSRDYSETQRDRRAEKKTVAVSGAPFVRVHGCVPKDGGDRIFSWDGISE